MEYVRSGPDDSQTSSSQTTSTTIIANEGYRQVSQSDNDEEEDCRPARMGFVTVTELGDLTKIALFNPINSSSILPR